MDGRREGVGGRRGLVGVVTWGVEEEEVGLAGDHLQGVGQSE